MDMYSLHDDDERVKYSKKYFKVAGPTAFRGLFERLR
jgi:hypothetical protein